MKKNFAKKLATVLSLTMVASLVVPAMPASAATAPDLAKRRTYVYEGNEYSYAAINAKGYTVKWSVSGEGAEFVDLSATKGTKTVLTVATEGNVAAKLAPVAVKAKFYKDGELKKTRTDNVNIKVSATGVAITETATVAAGETTDFNRTLTPANATSKTYWTVTDTNDKAVDAAVATIDAAGNFVANKVGDYKVVATVSNAKGSAVLATDTQAVKVVNKLLAVSQKSTTTINATFTANVKDVVKASDFTVKNADTLIKQDIKSVSFSEDGKTAYIELYMDLANEKTYEVTFDGVAKTFVANAGAPVKVVVTGKEITYNEATAVDIKLFDANGIDVTTAANMAKLDVTTDRGYYDAGAKKLTLYSIGDVATLKATFHTYTYGTDGKEVKYEATATFTAVKKAAATMTTITSTVVSGNPDWTKLNSTVAVKDADYKLVVKAVYSDKVEKLSSTGALTLESTDTSKLIIGTNGVLLPVSVGNVVVKVKDGDTVIGTVNVTVGAERKATSVSLDKYAITLSKEAAAADSQTVKITVKDQYGAEMSGGAATVVTPTGKPAPSISGREVTFAGPAFAAIADGSYAYAITYKDLTQNVTVNVKSASNVATPASIRLTLSATEKDAKYVADAATNSAITIDLYSYDANGVKIAKITTGYNYKILKSDDSVLVNTTSIAGAKLDVISCAGGILTQTAADTYKVVITNASNNAVVDTATIKITNTQLLPVVTQKTNEVTTVDALSLAGCFEAKIDGNTKTVSVNMADVKTVTGGNAVLVEKVTVTEVIGGYTLNHVVTVNAIVYDK